MTVSDTTRQNSTQSPEGTGDELAAGTQLSNGTYTIVRHLKTGGFGITYLATDTLGRATVIKECFPSGLCARSGRSVLPRSHSHDTSLASLIDRFVAEAHSLAKISHPNVVKVHQVFKENGTAYMALDHVEGHDLLEVMSSPALALSKAGVQTTLLRLLEAVGTVHGEGLLHRDISPDNILIDAKRNPVLIDFGAAREQKRKADAAVSTLNIVKDGYSPQEFYLSGGGDQGPWSDLYSLAATFYHVIAGEAPPNSQSRLAAMAANTEDPCQPLAGRFDGYDPGFLAAIDKAMSVLPKDRLQSARDWIAAVTGRGDNVVRMPSPEPSRIVTPMTRVTRAEAAAARKEIGPGVMVGGALAVAVVAVGVYLAMPGANTAQVARLPADVAAATTSRTAAPAAETAPEAASQPLPDPAPTAAPAPEPAPTPAPAGSGDRTAMTTNWTVDLPFATQDVGSNVIATTSPGAPDWMVPGVQILAVNGTEIQNFLQIADLVRQSQDPGDAPVLPVTLTVVPADGGAAVDQTLDLPVVQRLILSSGAEFITRWVDGAWQSQVATLPENYTGELRLGDIIIGHVSTGTRIDSPMALRRAIEGELVAGSGNIRLAVQQGAAMWVVVFPLPS
jgi:hypothetical protein